MTDKEIRSGEAAILQKQAEEALASSLSLLKATMESTADGILVVDLNGRITLWNHKFAEMWQIPEELLSKHLDELALNYVFQQMVQPEAFLAKVRELYGQPEESSNDQLDLADGRIFGRYSQPQKIGDEVVGRVWSFSDITDRKQMEEKLRMSEADLQQAQAVAHVGSWRWDIAHDEFVWSDEMCRIFGVAPHAFTGSVQDVIARVIHPDDRARIEESNRAIIKDHNPQPLEYRIVWPDGSVHTVWVKPGEMTLDDKGHVSSLTGVVLDITERKQAEAQLRQSQKMEAIGILAGGVAHDFNNLLTGILGNIALMRSSLPPADPLLENLNAAETAARQAADLTKGLLTFSRSAMVLPVPMNLTAALDATLALLKQSLPATMEIVRDYEQTAWNVLVDQSQMTQILLNLGVNARDAMKGKGTLTIRARNEVVGEEYLQTHPFARTGEFVHLSVTDTGPGMSSEVMQHLFEPFYTTKPIGSGTGLGLSIVYGAVKQAGGWITAVSTEGVGRTAPRIGQTCSGATFDIYLPRCLEEPMQSFTPGPTSVNVRGGTVLVVEDEPVVRTVTQALLSRSGYRVLTAPDGASALSVLREHLTGIGLILLDMTMPGMTTDDIVQKVRAIDVHVAILLTSGYTSGDTVKRMLAEGTVQGFLPKPYELHELLSTINQLMKRP